MAIHWNWINSIMWKWDFKFLNHGTGTQFWAANKSIDIWDREHELFMTVFTGGVSQNWSAVFHWTLKHRQLVAQWKVTVAFLFLVSFLPTLLGKELWGIGKHALMLPVFWSWIQNGPSEWLPATERNFAIVFATAQEVFQKSRVSGIPNLSSPLSLALQWPLAESWNVFGVQEGA